MIEGQTYMGPALMENVYLGFCKKKKALEIYIYIFFGSVSFESHMALLPNYE